jgi:hypothetical protein
MIIVGCKRIVESVLTYRCVCDRCGRAAAHALRRSITLLTVFFIPVLPIRRRYSTVCTYCGAVRHVSGRRATELRAPTGPGRDPSRVAR